MQIAVPDMHVALRALYIAWAQGAADRTLHFISRIRSESRKRSETCPACIPLWQWPEYMRTQLEGFAFICCRKRSKAADWDSVEATPATNSWEATPGATPAAHWEATPGATPAAHWDATPGATPGAGSRWDATPTPGRAADGPTPRRNRWDETPTPGRVRS